jgi:hypothetical protein
MDDGRFKSEGKSVISNKISYVSLKVSILALGLMALKLFFL